MTSSEPAVVRLTGFSHVRLTVTDIHRSKAFHTWLSGAPPRSDFSDQANDPRVLGDPDRTCGGCSFHVGDQVQGLRPVAPPGDRFVASRVGLDHLSLAVANVTDLHAAVARLDEHAVPHGAVTDLPAFGLTILFLQDPATSISNSLHRSREPETGVGTVSAVNTA